MRFWPRSAFRTSTVVFRGRPPGRDIAVALFFAATAALGIAAPVPAPSSLEENAAALYRPFQAEMVSLSPDGRHLAYTRHERGQLFVVIVDVDNPTLNRSIKIEAERTVMFSNEKEPPRLRYLRWMTPNRLIMAPSEQVFELPVRIGFPVDSSRKFVSPIWAINADGSNPRKLADGSDFAVSLDLTVGAEEPMKSALISRRINFVGHLAGDTDNLLVEALGQPVPSRFVGVDYEEEEAPASLHLTPIPTSLFKINIYTGKSSLLAEEFGEGKYLYDWQGRPRVLYQQIEHLAAREFLFHPSKGGRWLEPGEQTKGRLPKDFTLSPANYFGERAIPLAFDFDARVLYFASNVARDTSAIYGLDTETMQRTPFAIEHPHVDLAPLEPLFPNSLLVFDEKRQRLVGVRATGVTPFTVWIDPELAEMQRTLEKKFSGRTVEVLEWDDTRQRFLVRVSGGSDAGSHFVYRRPENRLVQFLERAPWLRPADLHETAPFEFDTPEGVHLTGYLTLPRTSRLTPPPLVVYFPAGFPARAQPDFDADAQMLASLGVMVVRLNHRGAIGFGARHRDAIQQAVDRVPIDDALATAEWLAKRHPFDRRRIATMGEGFGGYLALRALQLHPATFRCAIGIDAPMDLEAWLRPSVQADAVLEKFFTKPPNISRNESLILRPSKVDFTLEVNRAFFQRNASGLTNTSILRSVSTLTKPVFLIVTSQRSAAIESENSQLRSELRRMGRPPDYLEVKEDYALRLPAARARAFRRIEEFFNLNLYDYKVDVGQTKALK